MKILSNDQINLKVWEQLIADSPFKSPFQTKAFLDLINLVNGFEGKVYAVEENNELSALCVTTFQKEKGIKGFFSRRVIIYGGPIFKGNKNAVKFLLKHIADDSNKAIYIETRNFSDYSDYKNEFESSGWEYHPYLNFHLNCANEEEVWRSLNTNRQRQIKKALKQGVKLEVAKSLNEVQEFYAILSDLYRTKIKKPLFPLEFFEKFISSGVGEIILVKLNDKIIGGIACPILNNYCIYELYICGLDQEFKDCSPSVMATYSAIEYAYKHNLKRFDFMGAGKPEADYGVRDFKGKFGGDLVEHGRFIKINNRLLYSIGKMAISILSNVKGKKN